jgi:hypothetical protein
MKQLLALMVLNMIAYQSFTQNKTFYENAKRFVVQIGYLRDNKFQEEGSGIMCYLPYKGNNDSGVVEVVITARHMINYFLDSNIQTINIRPSWADSIKTTDWTGVPTNLMDGTLRRFFVPKDPHIDLACILLGNLDEVSSNYYSKAKFMNFPYNHIANPNLGDPVIVAGYPSNVENAFSQIGYSVCTLKPGMVSWISNYKVNAEIDKVLLVDCNASYGNSGGPVFSTPIFGEPKLIGIQSGIYWDDPAVLELNGLKMADTLGHAYYVRPRSGSAIIVKAEYVKNLLEEVSQIIRSDPRYLAQ